jgi:SHS2 domain-containing protein
MLKSSEKNVKMSSSFKYLAHTADIRLQAKSETLPELFSTCLKGMNELLKPGFCHNKTLPESAKIQLEAADSTVLLVNFLSEILTLSYLNHTMYCECQITKMTDNEIRGILKGEKIIGFDNDIKAVTFHEADVHMNKYGDFETVIVFDI